MEIIYYIVNNDWIFRTRESEEEFYPERLEKGEWVFDASLLKYFFEGEPGAVELTDQSMIDRLPK